MLLFIYFNIASRLIRICHERTSGNNSFQHVRVYIAMLNVAKVKRRIIAFLLLSFFIILFKFNLSPICPVIT